MRSPRRTRGPVFPSRYRDDTFPRIVAGKYEILLIDAPWGGYTSSGTAVIKYDTMTTEQLVALPLEQWMAKRCVLFVWVTGPMLYKQQREVIDTWCHRHKLAYQGMPYIWIKTKKDGITPIGAAGPRPRLVKPVTEFVIALSNVKNARAFPLLTESQRQLVFAPKPRTHSSKPLEVHRRIVELLGDRSRIELFARERVPGWDAWGNEVPPEKLGVKCGKARLIRLARTRTRRAG